jgi:hypothetical protein
MPKAFPAEFRRDVVAVARKGDRSIASMARDFGVSESCLQRWLVLDWTSDASTRTVTLLREALMSYPALTPSLSDAAAPSRGLLRSQVEQVWNAYQASRFALATTQLPRVIAGAKAALREGDTSEGRRDGQRMFALVRNCLDCLGRQWPYPWG